ncbi:MAG: archease [Actinobacteria bacterium]|nr:archease [Actinomycetota bacterium]
MSTPRWEHFPHEADMGVRGIAPTKNQAFEEAALAMTAVVTDLVTVNAREAVEVHCEAPDDELLLVDWLNTLVFEMATRKWLFGRFEVKIDHHRLSATAWGEPIDRARHQPAVEIKGATYTALRVAQENGQWIAQTVVDV